jgi:CRP-like cAMP-binding protein
VVREIKVQAGEILIEAGPPAGFVYVPLGEGLRIEPLGGCEAFANEAWVPVGVTGVIREAIRNANVVAERDLSLLAIPKDVFLKHWHHTYTQQEFAQLFNPAH